MKIYKTENIINCRDLGGYPCRNGETKYGIAVRCGIPKPPTNTDIDVLKKIGIKSVIDLRGDQEAESMPSYFKDSDDFEYKHFSLLEANPAFNRENKPLWTMYAVSLKEYSAQYAQALSYISSLDSPFLYHCFLGKDRTGLLSAVLLELSGVDRKYILDDYEPTYDIIKPFVERELAMNTGLIWEQDISRLQSKREYLGSIFSYVDENYDGFNGYVKAIGLNNKEISRLENLLIK